MGVVMKSTAKIAITVYSLVLVTAAALTVTRVNPVSFPTVQMTAVNLLPMLGFFILFLGSLAGGGMLYFLGEPRAAKVYAMAGLVFSLGLPILVCNVARKPLLRSIAARAGQQTADRVAAEEGGYSPPVFEEKKQFPHLSMFLKRKDTSVLREAYCDGYKQRFRQRYRRLIPLAEIKETANEHGYQAGIAAGRNAARRGEEPGSVTMPEPIQEKLREKHLAVYVDAYSAGYRAGYHAAFDTSKKPGP
mgnify:CR=1 FL=1